MTFVRDFFIPQSHPYLKDFRNFYKNSNSTNDCRPDIVYKQ